MHSPPVPFSACRHYPSALLMPSKAKSGIPTASEHFPALPEHSKQLLSHHGSPWSLIFPPQCSSRYKPLIQHAALPSASPVPPSSSSAWIFSNILHLAAPRCSIASPCTFQTAFSHKRDPQTKPAADGREEPTGQKGRDRRCRGRDGASQAQSNSVQRGGHRYFDREGGLLGDYVAAHYLHSSRRIASCFGRASTAVSA